MFIKNAEDKAKKLNEERRASSILLKDLAVELEEQLYEVKIQIKSNISQLQTKENELNERERTKIHNYDVFSPIYNQSYDTSELILVIEQLKNQGNSLKEQELLLQGKISGLKTAAQCIEILVNEEENKSSEADQEHKLHDKGLSILEAQEIERQRIARDLHDSTVQNLTSLVHKSELCAKLIDIDAIRAKLELNTMSNTLKSVINDMRQIILNLKPMTLDDLGLTITIERYANKIMDLNNIQVKVQANEEKKEILPVIKLTLYRIIQEACNNILKHANASLINIDINYEENRLNVEIKDNGKGFDIKKLLANSDTVSSFGISIMKERISLLSGKFDIQSEEGKGTNVTISVPFTFCREEENEQTD